MVNRPVESTSLVWFKNIANKKRISIVMERDSTRKNEGQQYKSPTILGLEVQYNKKTQPLIWALLKNTKQKNEN